MNTCSNCISYQEGKCLMSCYLGSKFENLLSVSQNELACDSFEESGD